MENLIQITKIYYINHKINGNCLNFEYKFNNQVLGGQYCIDTKEFTTFASPHNENMKEIEKEILKLIKEKIKLIQKIFED